MVERELERTREPEPKIDHYQLNIAHAEEWISLRREGKRLLKFEDVPWEQGRQGLLKFYSTRHIDPELAAPGWLIFMHRITKHSGKHIHQGGLAIFILEGKGYTVVDGVRYDWKKGDLLLLPLKPGGVEHQHFNEDPDKPSHWIALIFHPWFDYTASQLKQVAVHPDWVGEK